MRMTTKIYDPTQPLISLHVPKCAGSSFSEVLRKWFKRGYLPHYPNERKGRLPKKHALTRGVFRKRPRHRVCIHGHFNHTRGFGARQYYPHVQQYITVLRDPFDLHLSTYFYVRREALTKGIGAFHRGKAHPIIQNDWDVAQYLENIPHSYLRKHLPRELNEENCAAIMNEQFLYVGITEQLQRAVDDLAALLGFETVSVPQRNVSDWSEPIPPGARDTFEANNPAECAVYRYALARLES